MFYEFVSSGEIPTDTLEYQFHEARNRLSAEIDSLPPPPPAETKPRPPPPPPEKTPPPEKICQKFAETPIDAQIGETWSDVNRAYFALAVAWADFVVGNRENDIHILQQ
jgi:hypothetical protein